MLEIKNLEFSYRRNGRSVFNDFSLTLRDGTVNGLLGKNGTGKSTLLYLIHGLLLAKAGEITLDGVDVKRRLPQTLQDTYLVPEEFEFPDVSLRDYLKVNSKFYPHFSMEEFERNLEDFELDKDLKNLRSLSMGQKKKAIMSFALATNTRLLMMDEPSNGFDIPSKRQMRRVIASNMSDEKIVVISTHQVRDVENLLDNVVILDGGRVVLNNSTADITRGLRFVEQPLTEPLDDAIYSQPSLQGNSAIYRNLSGEETPVNLETLFNATLTMGDQIVASINNSKTQD